MLSAATYTYFLFFFLPPLPILLIRLLLKRGQAFDRERNGGFASFLMGKNTNDADKGRERLSDRG